MRFAHEPQSGAAPPRLRRHAILAVMLTAMQPQAAVAQATSGVREAVVRFESALMSGDAAAATTFFVKDGSLVAGACGAIGGRPAVRSFLNGLVRSGAGLAFTPEDSVQTGDVDAREVGTFRLTGPDPGSQSGDGRYVTTWVRRGGDWKVSMMVWETPRSSRWRGCPSTERRLPDGPGSSMTGATRDATSTMIDIS